MRYFEARLWNINSSFERRRWIFVPHDQLNSGPFSLLSGDPRGLGIVVIESADNGQRRAYQKQTLALVLANQRQFALEQANRGVAVRYLCTPTYAGGLRKAISELGALECMAPTERDLRRELEPLVDEGLLVMVQNRLWLTTAEDFRAACGDGRWKMERFYQYVRRKYGIMVDAAGKPAGGRWSFDVDNPKGWPGRLDEPAQLSYEPDGIVHEVCADVEKRFGDHPGALNPEGLPTTAQDAMALWQWAQDNCLEHFEPCGDVNSWALAHTMVSSLMNLGRLSPVRLVNEVLPMSIPTHSKEGFVRQLLGWREFVRHVDEQSDGFRRLPQRFEDQLALMPGGRRRGGLERHKVDTTQRTLNTSPQGARTPRNVDLDRRVTGGQHG